MSVAYLEKLNPEQRRAVEHGVRENDAAPGTPLLVIAGAGSGKTNTLAHRVAHLIVNGADTRKILLMTFSRRAAAEMARRVEQIVRRVIGDSAGVMTDALWAGTFHGIGARLLRDYAGEIGLDPAFTVHDREDSADLMNLMRHELGFSKTENRFPAKGTCLAVYSRCVNAELPIEDVLATSFPWCAAWAAELKQLFAVYVEAKQRQNVLDYDDLLLYWAQMVSDLGLAGEIGERFDHVLVDEYQDTNRLQASILLALKPGGRGLTVVGDDAQSIYSFRAATVRNILDFPSQFSPPAAIITLDRNYRSTQPILASANKLAPANGDCTLGFATFVQVPHRQTANPRDRGPGDSELTLGAASGRPFHFSRPNCRPASTRTARRRKPNPSLSRELPMKTGRFDIHQHITDKIVSVIECGAGEFRLPSHRSAGSIMRPVNIASKKAYRGINVVALWAYAEEFGYSSGVWGSYKQWAEAGAQVRQGEKAAFVVFYKELVVAADPESGDAEPATRLFARATPVFAAEQADGFMPSTIAAPPA